MNAGEILSVLAQPLVIGAIFLGVIVGAVCGLIPGVGGTFAIGISLPFSFLLPTEAAISLIIAISVGAAFVNSPAAIMLGLAGNSSAIITVAEGHSLTKRGKAGLAMAVAWLGATAGQLISVPLLALLLVPLSYLGYVLLAPEMFALYFVGLVAIGGLMGKDAFRGVSAVTLGAVLSMIGPDPVSAVPRMTFGLPELSDGLPVLAVALGVITLSASLRMTSDPSPRWPTTTTSGTDFPHLRDLRGVPIPIVLGALVGTLIGAIPGMGATTSSVIAHQLARAISRRPEEFGRGSVDGLAASEAAQNGAQAGELAPTLGLGIPGSDSAAILLAALSVHGFVTGPMMISQSPEVVTAALAALLGGSVVLLLFGFPAGRLLLNVLRIDRRYLLGASFFLALLGIFSYRGSTFDVLVALVFGVVGYGLTQIQVPVAAVVVGFLLGGPLEANLRRGLLLTDGDLGAFLGRPWVLGFFLFSVVLLVAVTASKRRTKRPRPTAAGSPPTG